jgi:hypothetical protein
MATATETAGRIERSLSALRAEVDWLPNRVAEWDTTSESERISVSLDWDHLLCDYLTELDVSYAVGDMTEGQQNRYLMLLRSLRDALPLFARIGIWPPTIPLHAAPLSESIFTRDEIDAQIDAITVETSSLPRRLRRATRNLDRPESDWRFDWQDFAARLRGLENAACSGVMTVEQRERYDALRAFLIDYLPFLRSHGTDVLSPRMIKSTAAD